MIFRENIVADLLFNFIDKNANTSLQSSKAFKSSAWSIFTIFFELLKLSNKLYIKKIKIFSIARTVTGVQRLDEKLTCLVLAKGVFCEVAVTLFL